jgi:hypothetical protein
MAKLLQGGKAGFAWPDFAALGLPGHASFGYGPAYRGRLSSPSVLVLADQTCHDDLFFARALTGDAGQHLQGFLDAAGLETKYAILRTLPVNALGASTATVHKAVEDAQVRAVLREIIRKAGPKVVVATGAHAASIVDDVSPASVPTVTMKAWGTSGALADWKRALHDLAAVSFPRDHAASPWDGKRQQIPRGDLPYGTLRWEGTSGDRAAQAKVGGKPSADYFKVVMPDWAFALDPAPLTAGEQHAIDLLKV